jgi:hypothetical protein
MKRLHRTAFTAAAAASFALFLLAGVLAASSYWAKEHFAAAGSRTSLTLDVTHGLARVEWRRWERTPPGPAPVFVHQRLPPTELRLARLRGADLRDRRAGPFAYQSGSLGYRFHTVVAPCWTAALVAAALPIRWLTLRRRWRRERRDAAGLCPECAYDLRATPGQCSECGWAAAAGPSR